MRSLCILLGVALSISIVIGCQADIDGLPVSVGKTDTVSDALKLNITGPVDESVVRSSPITVSGTTDTSVDLMINGLSVSLENGRFKVLVELEPGPNVIDILAKDASGKQASKYLTIVYVP
ncbi:MAG: hypothetical protein JXA01_03935 [Dehalococcoidia bacterium]|nr:hypothetical protein [Dehalococcoidia bacterium]